MWMGISFVPWREAPAVLHYAKMAGGDLVVHPVVKKNDAVGDVFLEPVTSQLLAAPLGGDHCRYPLDLEPAKEPAQLGAKNRLILKSGEKRLQCVKNHAFGPNRIDLRS